jgi:hypothetical protein
MKQEKRVHRGEVPHELHEIYLEKAFYLDSNAPNQAKF